MDKYEYKIRSQEIRDLIAQGEYAEAAEIADTIDWRRVKSVMMLCTISDLYKINRRFEESKELLLLAYDRHPSGRTILYSLCELSIKMGEFVQAIEYYKEFVQIAPKDTGRYVLQYKLYVAQEVSLEERIEVLEELKKRDYREKWAYELAYLYHRVGLATRCVEECDELILWFGEGKYVTKAMELKMLHQPLSAEQQAKYEGRFEEYRLEQEQAQNATTLPVDEDNPMDVMTAPTVEITSGEIEDIQVKTLDVGEYNTINLQKELADSMKELWETAARNPEEEQVPVATEEYFTAQTGELEPVPVQEEVVVEEPVQDLTDTQRIMQEIVAPLFAQTDDMSEVAMQLKEPVTEVVFIPEEPAEEVMEATLPQAEEMIVETDAVAEESQAAESEMPVEELQEEPVAEFAQPVEETQPVDTAKMVDTTQSVDTAEQVLADMQKEITPQTELKRPGAFDKYLGMDYDGQMSFVVPEADKIEKQITGQLNIEDILAEWERMKRENEQKQAEEVRQLVLQHTGNILIDFEQAAKEGLLERLEQSEGISREVISESTTDLASEEESFESETLEEIFIPEEEPEQQPDVFRQIMEREEAELAETTFEEAEPAEAYVDSEQLMEEAPQVGYAEEEEPDIEELFEDGFEPAVVEDETASAEENTAVEERTEASDVKEEPAEISGAKEEEADLSEDEEEALVEESVQKMEALVKPEPAETKSRELTDEEMELYASYAQDSKSKEQLVKAIDSISLAPYTGNVVITGEEGMDTLGLAKNMMKEVQMMDNNFSGKIAKISGNSMNQRDMEKVISKLNNGALIIENAGKMNVETAKNLYKALQQENRGIVVIMEGTKKPINRLFEAVPELKDCFNARINIEALDNDSLVAYGKKYAKEQEYAIDEMGLLALHTCISDRQTSDHAVTLLEVKEIVDDAIAHANKKTIGHFFDILFAKRYDDEDMIILRENDFM